PLIPLRIQPVRLSTSPIDTSRPTSSTAHTNQAAAKTSLKSPIRRPILCGVRCRLETKTTSMLQSKPHTPRSPPDRGQTRPQRNERKHCYESQTKLKPVR